MIPVETIIYADTVTVAGWGRIMRILNRDVMTQHKDEGLEKHFENVPETSPGGGGYRYKRRGREYSKDKEEVVGHKRPNVYSGDFREAVLSKARVTATKNRSTLKSSGTSKHPVARFQTEEVSRLSNREKRKYSKQQGKEFVRMAALPEYKRKRRVSGSSA